MRFLALCFIALSFASLSTAKIITGSPPAWPSSYSADYSSVYRSAIVYPPVKGSIGVSNNEKIRVESSGDDHLSQTIIVKGPEGDADIYCTRTMGKMSPRCRHSKRPFNPLLSNNDNQCTEFQYKEGLINGIIADGWSTVCSIASKDLSHRPMRGHHSGATIQFSLTYYYQDSTPLAIFSSPLSGPGVNTNSTIVYSNFQSVNPDASLFAPPAECRDGKGEGMQRPRWGHKGFGGGIYRDESHPRNHHRTAEDFFESTKKDEGIDRSLEQRSIRILPVDAVDANEETGKNDQIHHHQGKRHLFGRRHVLPMDEMKEMPPKRGGMRGHMGEGMGGNMGGEIGDDMHDRNGELFKGFLGKRLSAHVTKMALKLIHFVNTKYLQKQG